MTPQPPAGLLDWQGKPWDAGRRARPRIPTRASPCPPQQCPSIAPNWEDPAGRADLRLHLRLAPRAGGAARLRGLRLGPRRLPRLRDGLRDHRGHHRPGRRGAPRSRWRCSRSAATTWPTTSRTGCRCGPRLQTPPKIFRVNWFRRDARRQVPVAGLRRERARPQVDRRAHPRRRRRAVETPIGYVPAPGGLDELGTVARARRARGRPARRPRGVAAGARRAARVLRAVR